MELLSEAEREGCMLSHTHTLGLRIGVHKHIILGRGVAKVGHSGACAQAALACAPGMIVNLVGIFACNDN